MKTFQFRPAGISTPFRLDDANAWHFHLLKFIKISADRMEQLNAYRLEAICKCTCNNLLAEELALIDKQVAEKISAEKENIRSLLRFSTEYLN